MPPTGKRNPPGQGTSRSARRRRNRKRTRAPAVSNTTRAVRQSRQQQPKVNSGASDNYSQAYARVLDDPFSHEPVKLGFGCLVDTQISMARVTATIAASSTDGSLLLVAKTNAQIPLSYSAVATNTTPVWTNVTDGSWSTASGMYLNARPIALGLKVTPISAGTDKCSRVVGTILPYDDTTDTTQIASFDAVVHASWFSTHLGSKAILESGGGESGLQTWRPMSLKNFTFDRAFFAQVPSGNTFPTLGPVLVAAVSGPNSQSYDVELIYYYEALSGTATISPGTNSSTPGNRASDYFPSIESFYNAARTYLTDDNVTRAVGAATTLSQVWQRYSHQRLIPYNPLLTRQTANVAESEVLEADFEEEEVSTTPPRRAGIEHDERVLTRSRAR